MLNLFWLNKNKSPENYNMCYVFNLVIEQQWLGQQCKQQDKGMNYVCNCIIALHIINFKGVVKADTKQQIVTSNQFEKKVVGTVRDIQPWQNMFLPLKAKIIYVIYLKHS